MSLAKYMIEAGIEKKDLQKSVETVKLCLDYLHNRFKVEGRPDERF